MTCVINNRGVGNTYWQSPSTNQAVNTLKQAADGQPWAPVYQQAPDNSSLVTGSPGVVPPAGVNGQGTAYTISGLSQRKDMVLHACEAHGITDPTRQAQIMAAGLLEGGLDRNTDPKCIGVFNLNTSLCNAVSMGSLAPDISNTGNLSSSINASVQVFNAALDKGSEWLKTYQRGGVTLNADPAGQAGTYGYQSYSQAYDDTVKYLQSGSRLTDDYRFSENVGMV